MSRLRRHHSRHWRRNEILRYAAAGLAGLFIGVPVLLILIYAVFPPPLTSVMLIRLVEGYGISRDWTPLAEIAPAARYAVIAAEDNKFCQHSGVDWDALGEAASKELEGGDTGGASTLTMQTARNLMLWPGRSYVRKGLEIYVAMLMDTLWSKQRLLEIYLNIAEWGPGVFGIEAAAQHHYGKPASQLSTAEAARLAVILPNPLVMSPHSTGYVTQRAGVVMRRMGQLGPLLDCARP